MIIRMFNHRLGKDEHSKFILSEHLHNSLLLIYIKREEEFTRMCKQESLGHQIPGGESRAAQGLVHTIMNPDISQSHKSVDLNCVAI